MRRRLARPTRHRPGLRPSWRPCRRVLPAAGGRDVRVDFSWSPGAGLVLVDWGTVFQYWIDDSPRLFDIVLPREQSGVSPHGVSQHSLVCIHLIRAGMPGPQHLRRLAAVLFPRGNDIRADGDLDGGTDPEAAVIGREIEAVKHGGGLTEPNHNLRRCHRQALSRPDVE